MGIYFNPDNNSFKQDVSSRIYVDKTELINELNAVIGTSEKCIALSHARRFGKSQAAGMIDAYYSIGSDSKELFSKYKISTSEGFEKHLNKYNVIHVDISTIVDYHKDDLVETLIAMLNSEFDEAFSGKVNTKQSFHRVLYDVCQLTARQFVIIFDEWDCVIRSHSDRPDLVHKYLRFLHSIFKSEESKTFLALAYITGILPIKKIQDESALNNFREFTMVDSDVFTRFFGFTEEEVRKLCIEFDMDFDTVKQWYNGYLINGTHMYNPNSVYEAMIRHKYNSYWKNTSSYATINNYISMDFDGLKKDVLSMLSGGKVSVNINTFTNDLSEIRTKDEALTALIHLGYLGYDSSEEEAYIPNFEVAQAYRAAIETGNWSEVAKTISTCQELLKATTSKDSNTVAALIELAHETYTSVLKYNDENALSCVITMAYFTAPAYYTIVRELPTGKGFADLAFIPRKASDNKPAMIIELKYNNTADSAINQIKEKNYSGILKGYGDVLLVGISYDESKKHSCIIEKINI